MKPKLEFTIGDAINKYADSSKGRALLSSFISLKIDLLNILQELGNASAIFLLRACDGGKEIATKLTTRIIERGIIYSSLSEDYCKYKKIKLIEKDANILTKVNIFTYFEELESKEYCESLINYEKVTDLLNSAIKLQSFMHSNDKKITEDLDGFFDYALEISYLISESFRFSIGAIKHSGIEGLSYEYENQRKDLFELLGGKTNV